MFDLLLCCQPRRREGQADAAAQLHAGCGAELTATRAAADQRILRPKSGVEAQAVLTRCPSRSLLEASARRLALRECEQSKDATGAGVEDAEEVPLTFIKLYMAAIRDGNNRYVIPQPKAPYSCP
jgi:hypothetical protein